LTRHRFIDTSRDILQLVALHNGRDAVSDFNVLDAPPEFASGLGQRFAVFDGDQARNLFEVALRAAASGEIDI
jgi:hypothetical protein